MKFLSFFLEEPTLNIAITLLLNFSVVNANTTMVSINKETDNKYGSFFRRNVPPLIILWHTSHLLMDLF